MSTLTYPEAIVVGLFQGVSELFPASSLGHTVLIPALVGGSWARDLNVSAPESPYLAFIVGLHVATAAAMILYFWRDWARIIGGFISSLRYRRISTANERLAWMIILATIPVGISGLLLEHLFRVVFSKPVPTSLFLFANGLILLFSERRRRAKAAPAAEAGEVAASGGAAAVAAPLYQRAPRYQQAPQYQQAPRFQQGPPWGDRQPRQQWQQGGPRHGDALREHTERAVAADQRLSAMSYWWALLIGSTQIFALLPGISRDGIVTVTGMVRGLSREDAVRFSFLLSAPVILAAGVLKVPDLLGPLGNGIHGQVLAGSLLSFIGAYVSVRFLVKYFSESRSLRPFGIYCMAAGLFSLIFLLAFR